MDSPTSRTSEITHEEVLLMKKLYSPGPHLLDFSDCVLTLILSNLNSYDLYRLSKTCSRFRYLIKERKLWKKLDIVSHPMCVKKFDFFFENLNNTTDTVMLSGISKKEKTITSVQCHKLFSICNNLTVLAIENQYINSDEVRLNQFPKTLKELSLRGTHITGKQPFLQDAHKKLHNLHTLILDDCKWFHEHSLMALSKLPVLENLSLYNCRNLNDSIAYMSVTARFGFTKLLRIDARCTPIGDQFLKCFHVIKTLREIYLETPPVYSTKRGTLFDEIKRWCTSNMQSLPNVVIFNQTTVNTVFKRNRNVKRAKKEKDKSEPSSPVSRSTPNYDPNFNCVESCDSCSIETCGICRIPEKLPDVLNPIVSVNIYTNKPDIYAKNIEPNICLQKPLNNISERKEGTSTADTIEEKPEALFCDDISDSEDELDFQMFHSEVSDAGVQWFGSHDPQSVDLVGNHTVLFKKPYRKCDCNTKLKTKDPVADISEPGPSGLNRSSSQNKSKKSTPFKTSPNMQPRVLLKRAKIHGADAPPCSETKRPRTEKPSITVDVNIDEGDVHLEIRDDLVAARQVQQQNQAQNQIENNDNEVEEENQENEESSEEEQVVERPLVVRREPTPPLLRDENEVRNRDLRVIIERLDPGLHIVIDRAGRIQFGPMMPANVTKLKVFMARGYKMITDQALRSLSDLRLELLDVTGTSVTSKGIQEFLMVNPDCRVVHESICNCIYFK